MHTIYNFLIILLTTCDVANLIIIVNSYLILVVDKKFSEWFFVNSRAQVSVLPMSINSFRQVQAYFGVIHNLTHVHSNIMNGLSFFFYFFRYFFVTRAPSNGIYLVTDRDIYCFCITFHTLVTKTRMLSHFFSKCPELRTSNILKHTPRNGAV